MKCFHPQCNKAAPKDTLYRVNEKGVPGVWACGDHIKNTDAKVDPTVKKIVEIFEKRK